MFTICSFWLVSALCEIGELDRARDPNAARALQASGLVEAVVIKPFDASVLAACIRTIAATPVG